jgi:hypothetical protein
MDRSTAPPSWQRGWQTRRKLEDAFECWIFPVNRGKIMALDAAVRELRGDVIVFSHTSAVLNPDAIRLLVRSFVDPSVGSVSGKYTVTKPHEVSTGASEDFY